MIFQLLIEFVNEDIVDQVALRVKSTEDLTCLLEGKVLKFWMYLALIIWCESSLTTLSVDLIQFCKLILESPSLKKSSQVTNFMQDVRDITLVQISLHPLSKLLTES